MSSGPRRPKVKIMSSSFSAKESRVSDNEQFIPAPSRQGHLNEQTDFTQDPSLMFDELPQPFRRINKILESILNDAWSKIEQREQQRISDQSKFISAQHTSSTPIDTPFSVSIIASHPTGMLCFLSGFQNEQSYLACYDSQTDEIINSIVLEWTVQQMIVFKSDSSPSSETIYYLSLIDTLGYWRMIAYKNQQYHLLFTQYETEDDHKRPSCQMTRTGLNDEYLAVTWFGNNESWLEIYKLSKEQWKTDLTAQEQAMVANDATISENPPEELTENRSALLKGQYSRPGLLFKVKAPKFGAGSGNIQQLMKNTENQLNIGQGIANHLYTQQIIDAKMALVRELIMPMSDADNRSLSTANILKLEPPEPSLPTIPHILFIPTATGSSAPTALAVSWPTTNQLLIYKITKSESKGKDAFDTRPMVIWPFANRITSLTFDSKQQHLAIALQSGNVCIIERATATNDLPSVQHISSSSIIDIHALDSTEQQNGFLVLSQDGKVYRVKYKSILAENDGGEQQTIMACFPQEHSKDTSKIVRTIFFDCIPSNLFLSINERNRLYINDANRCKQLCEIVLSKSTIDNHEQSKQFQIALVDNTRSIIIGVPQNSNNPESMSLRLYRVPLEHFPSLENYYPERIRSTLDENELIQVSIETRPSKATAHASSLAKKRVSVVEKPSVLDEKIKEMFRIRQSLAYERRERLRGRWNEIKLHSNPVYETTTTAAVQ